MPFEINDIVRINGFRERSLFEVSGKHEYGDLYYVSNDEVATNLLVPATLFTLVCRAKNREDIKGVDN